MIGGEEGLVRRVWRCRRMAVVGAHGRSGIYEEKGGEVELVASGGRRSEGDGERKV